MRIALVTLLVAHDDTHQVTYDARTQSLVVDRAVTKRPMETDNGSDEFTESQAREYRGKQTTTQ